MSQWFRMYAEAVDDDKLRLLAFEDRWHFVAILCCKAAGVLDSHQETLDRRIAVKLGLQPKDLTEVKRRLSEVGLIDEDWQPSAWDRRQFSSDSSAERTRKWREKRHGDVTETSTTVTTTVTGDVLEQNRTEQRENGASAPDGLDAGAWQRWLEYRREIRKPLKPASIPAAQKSLAAFGCDQSSVVEQSIANGYQGLFALKEQPKCKRQERSGASHLPFAKL